MKIPHNTSCIPVPTRVHYLLLEAWMLFQKRVQKALLLYLLCCATLYASSVFTTRRLVGTAVASFFSGLLCAKISLVEQATPLNCSLHERQFNYERRKTLFHVSCRSILSMGKLDSSPENVGRNSASFCQ